MDGKTLIATLGGGMPDRRSKLLRAVVEELERSDRRLDAKSKAFFAKLEADYPHLTREPVFCWLWDNFEQVQQLRGWHGLKIARVGWDGIAKLMAQDGVLGSRGLPPNGNSVRRVWGRVVQDKARSAEAKAQESAG